MSLAAGGAPSCARSIAMIPTISLAPRRPVAQAVTDGAWATALSVALMLWRGRTDAGSALAPVNAVSHWFWPQEALRRDDLSVRHTGAGALTHFVASLLWAGLFEAVRGWRRHPTAANALVDAAAVTALAAVVDLKLVPKRLSPGFEERLAPRSVGIVYAGFAAGLALAGWLALRDR
jgi:hypothetical protein